MSHKQDTKKEESPFTPIGKDVERSLRKKRPEDGDNQPELGAGVGTSDGGAVLDTGGAAGGVLSAKNGGDGGVNASPLSAASVMAHYSDEPAAAPQPKLSRPYAPPKPSKNKRRPAPGADDGGKEAGKAKQEEAQKDANKEQAFS